jgi:TolA-binding protein
LLQAGKCQEHLENWKHAEKLYRQLLKLFPDNELAADAQDRLTRLQSIASNKPDKTASKTHR